LEVSGMAVASKLQDTKPTSDHQKTSAIEDPNLARQRADRGSVRPTLLKYVTRNPGNDTKSIAVATGIKDNSTRGGLNILRQEGQIVKRGDTWFPASPKTESAKENPGGETPGPINLFD
jgi:hypothetical protein